jgi:hypothetical protein
MAIINPAIENQTYNCTESTWYLDNEAIISFTGGNTSFKKSVFTRPPPF